MKAKFISKHWYKGRKILTYEYRVFTYEVLDDWTTFPLASQHKQEQAWIDSRLDQQRKGTEDKETEKAVCFKIFRKNQVFDRSFTMWCPKSACSNY